MLILRDNKVPNFMRDQYWSLLNIPFDTDLYKQLPSPRIEKDSKLSQACSFLYLKEISLKQFSISIVKELPIL